jgi:hypothetical protein
VAVPALIDLWSRCCGCHGISHLVDAVPLPASLSCVLGGQNEARMTRWITLHHRVGTAARALRGATLVLWVASIATALAPVQPSTAQISDGPTITPADLAQFDAWTNGPAHASASESGLGAARQHISGGAIAGPKGGPPIGGLPAVSDEVTLSGGRHFDHAGL